MVKDIQKRIQLQRKFRFPDTKFSPDIFIQIFEEIEKLQDRISKLEKVIKNDIIS